MSAGAGGITIAKPSECVRVVVRIRPLSSKERADGRVAVVKANSARKEITISNPETPEEAPRSFTFDQTYGEDSLQRTVYESTAAPIVESVLDGFNGTIFAYGQTGAGKSHTMEGYADPPEMRGIIPNSFKHIFDAIAANSDPSNQFLVSASYLEIYQEDIRDLLAKDPDEKLELKENADSGVYVRDLTKYCVNSVAEIDEVLRSGKKHRVTGKTAMNDQSSRSHAIFSVTVETSQQGADGKPHIRVGKLNMVDLAGSERQSKTGAEGIRLKEATKINLSLSALGNVISALVDAKSTHIPYRDSKLTRLLQDSLGGNTKTVMIANCGPANYNYDETLSTLRYAARAKQIKNKPRVNEDPKDAMLREFKDEIERLRAKLEEKEAAASSLASTTIMVDGRPVTIPVGPAPPPEVIERVVEVERVKLVGVSEEEVAAMRERAQKEREELVAAAQAEQAEWVARASHTEEERRKLQAEVEARAAAHEQATKEKAALAAQLAGMQEKLLVGGLVLDKAARQEEELRHTQMELEERRRQEEAMARELEEANLLIEEQYATMAEEVEAKTRKLKKVWAKLKAAQAELRDLDAEFGKEREDMLDTIRDLNRQLKLKQLLLDAFVPPAELERIEARAVWDEDADEWSLQALQLAGNRLRVRRPASSTSPALATLLSMAPLTSARPVSQYAAARAAHEPDAARFKVDNVAALDLEMPTRTTDDYEGAALRTKTKISAQVRAVLRGGGGAMS